MGGTREFHETILDARLHILNNEKKKKCFAISISWLQVQSGLHVRWLRYKSFIILLQLFLILECITDKYLSPLI